ncbi:hypothetical protein W04_3710 [Pseudoalteromonas sp. SW0106-04]|nr:hypothetical protein W04_3710 [Pseudoalteromonas sp. SW0106-04]
MFADNQYGLKAPDNKQINSMPDITFSDNNTDPIIILGHDVCQKQGRGDEFLI